MGQSLERIANAIQWHDGMLLGPQHFQQAFARQENLLHFHLLKLNPYGYGVITLKIDNTAILGGMFRIQELECIMPDGIEVSYDPKKDGPLELDTNQMADNIAGKLPQTVYLGIPLTKRGSSISSDELSRFKPIPAEPAFDENSGGEEINIPRMRPRLKLFMGEIPPANHVALPLLKFFKDSNSIEIIKYAPPSLKMQSDSLLWEIADSISNRFRQKIHIILDDIQRTKQLSQKQFQFDKHFTLQCLLASLPRFETILRSEMTHPYLIFLELASIAGYVYAMDHDPTMPATFDYQHEDAYASFEKISKVIFEILDKEIPTSFRPIRFTKTDNNKFTYLLPNSTNMNELVLGLKKPFQISRENFLAWIKSALICDQTQFEGIRERRLLGISRQVIETFDDLIPQRNIFLLQLTANSEELKPADTLVIAPSQSQSFDFGPEEVIFYKRIS